MLQRNFSGVSVELFKRMSTNSGKGCKYSPQLKYFALTLQFYSAKAYDFVRKTFNLALLHPIQIRKWYTEACWIVGYGMWASIFNKSNLQ